MNTQADNRQFLNEVKSIVGHRYILTDIAHTRRFSTGFRFGSGRVLAVIRPGTLLEQWKILQACTAAHKIIIMQAANTGLTGGSTPNGSNYDRDIVIINTMRIKKLQLIGNGRQVICFPGTTLNQLEMALKPHGREPHSVIGSSCIGASVFGGIANNSGGALIQRGPAFTQMALYAKVDAQGEIQLINHLGIHLGDHPEVILQRLETEDYTESDIDYDPARKGCDEDYIHHVREIDAETPARFNADPARLFEASGCAGKIMLFAARLDTFPKEGNAQVFYIGSNHTAELTEIRRHILGNFKNLPVAAEYMHIGAFDMAEKYGKDAFLTIRAFGTDRLPAFFNLKSLIDGWMTRLGFKNFSDRAMQAVGRLCPEHLPARMKDFRSRYEHHLLLKMSGSGIEEARRYLEDLFPSPQGDFFVCTKDEGEKAFLHRFVTAVAAVRYHTLHDDTVEDILSLDIALPRNTRDWFENLPGDIEASIEHKLYYGHFFCHVFHQDYIVRKGVNSLGLEHKMWKLLDKRNAEYPAEHNVGHLYQAKPSLIEFYRSLDPCNIFNPGIGQSSKCSRWA